MKAIICIGNILMGDDSIGVVLGYLLKKKNINCIICETDIALLNCYLNEYEKVIIIDAVDLSMKEGDYIIVDSSNYKLKFNLPHDLIIYKNKKVFLFGIQVKDAQIKIGISNTLRYKIKDYINAVLELYNSI